jgi:hypothetical protein
MKDRIKALEIEISYLRKAIEEMQSERPVEIHTHYHYDYSGMKPMIINDLTGLQSFVDDIDK